jgi:hypothetical protein
VPIATTSRHATSSPDDTLAVYVEIYEGDKRAEPLCRTL